MDDVDKGTSGYKYSDGQARVLIVVPDGTEYYYKPEDSETGYILIDFIHGTVDTSYTPDTTIDEEAS